MRNDTFILVVFGALGLLDANAAIGAAFGCAFHLSLPNNNGASRVLMPIVSLGIGYAVGLAIGEPHTMWASIAAAALGSTILSVFHSTILNGEDAPAWAKYIVDSVLRIKK